jgi:tetratricopeptide (TPR) repeat protein
MDAERLAQTRLEGERIARRDADRLLGEVTNERNQANLARQEADQSAAEAKAVVTFVVDDVLGAAAPSKTHGKAVSVLDSLANADRALEGKFANEPRVEASVRQSLAKVYQELGEYEKAEAHASKCLALREKALGPEHEGTLSAMHTLGWSYYLLGKLEKYEQAEALYRRTLEICRRTHGDDHELTFDAMEGLASILGRRGKFGDAVTLKLRVLGARKRTKGPADPETLLAMNNLAVAYLDVGQLKEAEPLLRAVAETRVKLQPDDPDTLIVMSNYASLLSRLSRAQEADDWATRSMDAHLRVLKFGHPSTQRAIAMVTATKNALGRFGEALATIDRAIEQAKREFGPEDPKTIGFVSVRVGVLRMLGDVTGAGSNAEEVLAVRERKSTPEAPEVLAALASLADIRRHERATGEATKLFVRLRDGARRALDASKGKNPDSATHYNLVGELVWAERLARTLGQPGRSDRSMFPPGVRGGPPRIDAPYQLSSPVADGRIERGEYSDSDGFSFDFAHDPNPAGSYLGVGAGLSVQNVKEPADLSVQMHAVHTSAALFLAFRVRDQSVIADPNSPPWENDCIEVFLDGDNVANDWTPAMNSGNGEGFMVTSDALGKPGGPRWKVCTGRVADGYVIEFAIPLDMIDTHDGPGFKPAATGSELRMNVDLLDFDEVNRKTSSYGLLWCEDRRNWSLTHGGEDFWSAALRLTPATAPEGAPPVLPADVIAPP